VKVTTSQVQGGALFLSQTKIERALRYSINEFDMMRQLKHLIIIANNNLS